MQVPGAVLPNAGIGQAIDTSGVVQANQHKQELALRKQELARKNKEEQQQRAATGFQHFQSNLGDANDLHTGSPVDPVNIGMRANILSTAASLYEKGADDMTVALTLAPQVQKLNTYVNTAKTVSAQTKDMIGTLAKDKGWNPEVLKDLVTKEMYYNADGTMKDPKDINPDVATAMHKVITENPDKVSNGAALNEYIDKTPRSTSVQDVTTYDKKGTQNKFKGKIIAPNFSTVEQDEKGNTTIVPKYQEAVDSGKKVYHDFINKDGSVTNAPVRLLDEGEYDKLMKSDAATHVIGLIKQHISEYKDDDGKPISLSSPKAQVVGRALMYDYLKERAKGDIESFGITDKPSPQAINLHLYGNKEQQAYDTEHGKREATVNVLGNDEQRAAARVRGEQSVKGTIEQQSEARAKGTAAGKAASKPPEDETNRIDRIEKASDNTKAATIAKKFEGVQLKDGSKITKVEKSSMFNPVNDFYINVEKDGKTREITFKSKSTLAKYLKENTGAPEVPKEKEDLRKKYNY